MSFNLIETVKNYFTGEFTKQVSSKLGESSSGIVKALTAVIPTSLAGILMKATSGDDGANSILEMAKNASSSNAGSPESTSPEKGRGMFSELFGANTGVIDSVISNFAGIKDSSAGSLMSMGLPAIMGILGKHAEQNNLSASGLAGFLSSQKDHILHAMPAGLSSIGGLLGLGSLVGAAHVTADPVKEHAEAIINKQGGNNWLWPLIIIVAAVLLLWYMSRSCNDTRPTTAAISSDTPAAVINADASTMLLVTVNKQDRNNFMIA
jgi:hypothetical protein